MIRRPLHVLSGLALFSGLLMGNAAQTEDHIERMQGEWKVVHVEVGNQKANRDVKKELKVIFDGHKFTLIEGDSKESAHIVLDQEAKPHTFEFYQSSERKQKLWHGVYQFDGDELRLCWGIPGDVRPSEFKPRPDSQDRYYVLRRPAVEPKHPALQHALFEMTEARTELKEAKHNFGGHRERALEALDDAIRQTEKALDAAGDKYVRCSRDRDFYAKFKYDNCPHLRHTLVEMREARTELKDAKREFGEHRERALTALEDAMRQVEKCVEHAR